MTIGKPITIGDSGLKPQLIVTAPSGSTLDVMQGSVILQTYTLGASETSHTFEVDLGTYVVRGTLSSQTKSETVLVDEVSQYSITITYSRLPSGYTETEYTQGRGNAYMNTGVIPTAATGFELSALLRAGTIIGGGTAYNSNYIGINVDTSTYSDFRYNSTRTYWSSSGTPIGTNGILKLYQHNFYYNGTLKTTQSGSISTSYPLYINAYNRSGSIGEVGSSTYYYIKMWNDTTLIRDYVPCIRDSDSVAGFFDLVNSAFYGSVGSATFIAGDPV